MKKGIDNIFVWTVISFIFIHFMFKIPWIPSVDVLLSLTGLIILLSSIPSLSKKTLIMPSILIVFSLGILFITRSSFKILWIGLQEMREIIPLVILISLINWIISYKPYVSTLTHFLQRKEKKQKTRKLIHVYSLSNIISFFSAFFMGIASIAFVFQLFKRGEKSQINSLAWDFTLSSAIMRGFALSVFWTTINPAFAYGIAGTNAPLFSTMVKGLGLSMIGLVIGLFIYLIQIKRLNVTTRFETTINNEKYDKKLLYDFFFWIGLLISLIFFLHQIANIEILVVVPLVTLFVTLIYFTYNRDIIRYIKLWKIFTSYEMKNKQQEMTLLISVGILVSTLKYTGIGDVLFNKYLLIIEWLKLDLLVGLTIMILLLGFSGLPPISAMVLLSGIIIDIPSGYSPELITLSLLLGVSITFITGPITMPLFIASSQNGRSLHQNGFVWNIFFGITLLIIGQIYLQLLRLL
ncbi:hypothetical protein [Alkalihalobacterium sp. APHAB7]|uniref:hypothetical protein n=1 Tax=Alkalihalobacterium sp. APHAB7 TaxID=3402081 RepID=UPI003AADE06F